MIAINKTLSLFMIIVMLSSFPLTVSAAVVNVATETMAVGEDNIISRMEETEWFYRVNNGRLERRLWSITFGYWKTNWMPVF